MKNFSLTRNERVKKKSDFEKIYSSAKVLFSSDRLIKVHFLFVDSGTPGIKIAAAVSKKSGKAVWRNRLKRLIKESYRINKNPLLEKVLNKSTQLLLVFSPNRLSEASNKKIYLRDVSPGVVELMNKIIQQI
ncbi:MAG: ribonuclease P protein component [Ignavibacteriaceae bacterium]|nr:ribonuclease P protein component [Ignavibacterium sp.]MCC6256125.1 ribonuclease P protein component [Ignavibacteriaceae bacterium]HMN22990.1 ribonuclease P protein component [Ignavibacteriaceae bacterium]HRN27241.1 ribonuclease P protein component [Ignavibacteriaceae bacterium]HRP92887.1 ribonuclease P protein component [Ignavibacteriaceae bacterium]